MAFSDCTKDVRILDLTNLGDTFPEVEFKHDANKHAGLQSRPQCANLRSFLFDRPTPFPASCPNTEELRVSSEIVDGQTCMISCLRYLHRLRTLDVRKATVGLGSFSGVTARLNCPNLTELRIDCCGSIAQENVHIANFIKTLAPHSLTKVAITNINQTCVRQLMDGLRVHAEALVELKLAGNTNRVLGLLPRITFMPALAHLEIQSSSCMPLSPSCTDRVTAWLMFVPNLKSMVLKGHDVDYLVHRALARPNAIGKVDLTLTRTEDVPLYRYDLFFSALASCYELHTLSISDPHNIWTRDAIVRCCGALRQLNVRVLTLLVHGLCEPDVLAILAGHARTLESLVLMTPISDRTCTQILHGNPALRFLAITARGTVSNNAIMKLLKSRDTDNEVPITICIDAVSYSLDGTCAMNDIVQDEDLLSSFDLYEDSDGFAESDELDII